jgi:hypothetical protein
VQLFLISKFVVHIVTGVLLRVKAGCVFRGTESILTQLQTSGVEDPSEYISFHGLRTHSVLHGELVRTPHSFEVQCMLLKKNGNRITATTD